MMNVTRILSICFIITLCSCHKKKDETATPNPIPTPTDFRDSLVGFYSGSKHIHTWIMGSPPYIFDTTYNYSFSIQKDLSSSKIIVDADTFALDSNYYYTRPSLVPPDYYYFEWRSDSAFKFTVNGGLGGSTSVDIKTKKQ